jgi:hypothetical protein
VADAHAADVGDCVPFSGREDSDADAEIADPRARVFTGHGSRGQESESGELAADS